MLPPMNARCGLLFAIMLAGCTTDQQQAWLKRVGLQRDPPVPVATQVEKPAQAGVPETPADSAQIPDTPVPAPSTARIRRADKVAFAAAPEQAALEFAAPTLIESQAGKIMRESIGVGTLLGGIPLLTCAATYLCTPVALIGSAALLAAGTAAGIVVGAGRVLAEGAYRTPPQPAALSPEEIMESTPVINSAIGSTIAQPALHQCVQRQLVPAEGAKEPSDWSDEERSVSLSALEGIAPEAQSRADAHEGLMPKGYRYVIESFVSRITLIPAGSPGQQASEVPASLVIKAGLRFINLANGQQHEQFLQWQAEPRTLRDWRSDNGAPLHAALKTACDALAGQIISAAELIWRQN
jgi:hypothetical protein